MDRLERINKVKNAMLSMQRESWEQGVAAQAFLELGDKAWVILFAKAAAVRQGEDGRLGLTYGFNGVTDPGANGEAVLFAAKVTGEQSLMNAAKKMGDWLLYKAPRTDEGILYHLSDAKQIWVDSFYMSPPCLAVLGHAEEAVKQIRGYRKLLWNPEMKLYSHIWDDERKDFRRKDFWGVGNGWAAAGITRVIKALPEKMRDEKELLINYLAELLDGCLKYLRDDGFFHDIIDNPATFVETNLSQMLSYSIYRGVGGGWLDHGYLKYADKMRSAVYEKVDDYGLVQGVCGSPYFDSPGTATEGQAFFLLMEAAAKDLKL